MKRVRDAIKYSGINTFSVKKSNNKVAVNMCEFKVKLCPGYRPTGSLSQAGQLEGRKVAALNIGTPAVDPPDEERKGCASTRPDHSRFAARISLINSKNVCWNSSLSQDPSDLDVPTGTYRFLLCI
ncbi:uncharacterized protein LOC142986191 [Anticarsia gemmatalis]|uniref:uncharacterized protein LOC142986191 n=1 Tax=Anticarsia gemmatalis TaxID=129554 RepID=UPI003F773464